MPRGPWVNVATVCEDLVQTEGIGVTLRGVTTGGTIAVPVRARDVDKFEVDAKVLLVLHLSGGTPGDTAQLSVHTEGEDGIVRPPDRSTTVQFAERQGSMRLPIHLTVSFWGEQLYWFNVVLNGRLLTRVPFEVKYDFVSPSEMDELERGQR